MSDVTSSNSAPQPLACVVIANGATVERAALLARGLKPEAADELLAFAARLRGERADVLGLVVDVPVRHRRPPGPVDPPRLDPARHPKDVA